ncbi:MAG: hypothetical protein O3B13_17800 [Planctomycetota bacterium]|nr:hypothetical protein [Planctomycetota bacterium]
MSLAVWRTKACYFFAPRPVEVALAAPLFAFVDLLRVALAVLLAARVAFGLADVAAPVFALVDLLTVALAVLFTALDFATLVDLAAPVFAFSDLLAAGLAAAVLATPALALVDLLTVALAVLFAARVVVAFAAPALALVDFPTVVLAVLFAAPVAFFAMPVFAFVDLLAAGFLATAGLVELIAFAAAPFAVVFVAISVGSFEVVLGTS